MTSVVDFQFWVYKIMIIFALRLEGFFVFFEMEQKMNLILHTQY